MNRGIKKLLRHLAVTCVGLLVLASMGATLLSFPWNTDPLRDETSKTREFYEKAYASARAASRTTSPSGTVPLSDKERYYVDFARAQAYKHEIPRRIDEFVESFGLRAKRVLEVGAGSGLLQDAVADYTGLDISPTARRYFHKPFVEASATDMPFPDGTFDALWSIWVLEHIPNPEKALSEMRRVVKPGGYIYLYPALETSRYAAQGYRVRPYQDFDWRGKLIKATVRITQAGIWHKLQYHQIHALRFLGAHLTPGPTRFHFTRLTPNYDQYWESDSDAITSLSAYELYLWFTSRGDACIGCASEVRMVLRDPDFEGFTFRVAKP